MCAVERLSARESNRACAMADVRCRTYRTVARSVQAAPLRASPVRRPRSRARDLGSNYTRDHAVRPWSLKDSAILYTASSFVH